MIVENSTPRLLILTLYSGENEFAQCIEAIQNQTYTNWKHEVFRFLPNLEAHQALYNKIMDSREDFNLFLKIDADMVLSKKDALTDIVQCFKREPDLDHAVFSVRDWYSQTNIMGLHAYTNRVSWPAINEKLFVDPDPQIKGYKKLFWNEPAPVADHSPNPTLEDAFLFGLHKALKVVQRDRWIKRASYSRFHFELLNAVWKEFLKSNDLRHGAVIWGAEHAFSGKIKAIKNKSDHGKYEESLNIIHKLGAGGIEEALKTRWSQESNAIRIRKWRWVKFPEIIKTLIRLLRKGKKFILVRLLSMH